MKRFLTVAIPFALAPFALHAQTWPDFNGDDAAQKFSTATQITTANVKDLVPVWTFHTGDYSVGGKGKIGKTAWSATPIFVNDTVYVGTPFYRVFALDPATGKPKWVYDTHSSLQPLTQTLKTRGVAYWQSPSPAPGQACQKIVYMGTMDAKLHAIDADSGKLCPAFGKGGILDINQWNTVNPKFPLSILQPPSIYKDTLVIGWAGKDWAYESSPPGTVFGVDARTGKLKWTFHAIPDGIDHKIGTSNVWASMSVDAARGIVYLPVSSPEPNFYGGDRKQPIPYGTSVTAVDAETGRVIWSRQLVHHDLWDFDTDSAPTLVDIHKDGKVIPALVQSSKQGFLYVLNRLNGEPIYPMTERRVPASDVPGEQASPTQPFVDMPAPTVDGKFPGISAIADVASLGWCSRTYRSLRDNGRFTPPSIRGSISYPAAAGGVEWGGGAVDPRTQTYVVNSSNVVGIYTLIPRAQFDRDTRAGKHPGAAQEGAPYAAHYSVFLNKYGMPCWNPPYGTMSSYDLRTGRLLWRQPFGEVQKWGFYMPKSWGSVTLGAPIVTATGLIFIGASMDARVRALDIHTGKELWSHLVDTPVVSIPSTYMYRGKQYVTFVAGGNGILDPRVGDEVVSFSLQKQ